MGTSLVKFHFLVLLLYPDLLDRSLLTLLLLLADQVVSELTRELVLYFLENDPEYERVDRSRLLDGSIKHVLDEGDVMSVVQVLPEVLLDLARGQVSLDILVFELLVHYWLFVSLLRLPDVELLLEVRLALEEYLLSLDHVQILPELQNVEFVLENEGTELFFQILVGILLVLGLLVVVVLDPDALLNIADNPGRDGLETVRVEPDRVVQRPGFLGLVPVHPAVRSEDAVARYLVEYLQHPAEVFQEGV